MAVSARKNEIELKTLHHLSEEIDWEGRTPNGVRKLLYNCCQLGPHEQPGSFALKDIGAESREAA